MSSDDQDSNTSGTVQVSDKKLNKFDIICNENKELKRIINSQKSKIKELEAASVKQEQAHHAEILHQNNVILELQGRLIASQIIASQRGETKDTHILPVEQSKRSSERTSQVSSNRPCGFFQSGSCKKGDSCVFAHIEPSTDSSSEKKGNVCRNDGHCKRVGCWFNHYNQ